jgi:hypothetical protein
MLSNVNQLRTTTYWVALIRRMMGSSSRGLLVDPTGSQPVSFQPSFRML